MNAPAPDGSAQGTSWTLALIASAFLALAAGLALVSPRTRSTAEPRTPADALEHEPPPSGLVAPRSAPEVAGATDGDHQRRESAWTAEDAAPAALDDGRASMPPAVSNAVLELYVTDAGRAAPGASVELVHEPEQGPAAAPVVHTADADGRVHLELAPGNVRATAWSAQACALPVRARLALGSPARLELALEPAYPVAGRVLDARTGAPVAGAEVALWTFAERDTVVSDANGSFLHPRFPARAPAQQIAARAPGYGVAVRYLRIDADGAWKIPGRTADEQSLRGTGTPWVELVLVPERVVRGRVRDEHGRPLAGARVAAEGFFHAQAAVATRDSREARSGADGSFALAGLRSDIGHSLLVEAQGRAAARRELEAGAAEIDAGELVLARETVLSGVVIDPAGRPVAGIEVVLREAEPEPVPGAGGLDVAVRVQGRERRATTTALGTFLFEGLAPQPFTLALAHEAGAQDELPLQPRPDGTFESPLLTLWPRAPSVAERTR